MADLTTVLPNLCESNIQTPMTPKIAFSVALTTILFAVGIANSAETKSTTLADGTIVKYADDELVKNVRMGLDARYTAKFSRASAELADQYIYNFSVEEQLDALKTNTPNREGRYYPIGAFDVAMNSTDLAWRAAGGRPLLPFSKSFQWGGIALGLAGMLLSGKSVDESNVDFLKEQMDWFNNPNSLQIRIVEAFKSDDPRLQDKDALLTGTLESIKKVLVSGGYVNSDRQATEVKVFSSTALDGSLPVNGISGANAEIREMFAHPRSIWRSSNSDAEVLVTKVFWPMYKNPERRQQQLNELKLSLATIAPANWYWIWVEPQQNNTLKGYVGNAEHAREFEPPPKGYKYESWLKDLAAKAKKTEQQSQPTTSPNPQS